MILPFISPSVRSHFLFPSLAVGPMGWVTGQGAIATGFRSLCTLVGLLVCRDYVWGSLSDELLMASHVSWHQKAACKVF